MKQWITTLFAGGLFALALFGGAAAAGQLEDGLAAAQRGDYAEAMRLLRPLAERGNEGAQFVVGGMYFEGKLGRQDYSQAALWFRKAASQGDAAAGYILESVSKLSVEF